MRIIAGAWRGRKLVAPPGDVTRPTADRVREAVFSMLASRLGSFEGLRVADVFAGSGALGLEALSRGAAHCSFVEQDRQAIAILRANIDALDAETRTQILNRSALTVEAASAPMDLIFLDPPYRGNLVSAAIAHLAERGWIGQHSWIAAETARLDELELEGFTVDTTRTHGAARISILRPA